LANIQKIYTLDAQIGESDESTIAIMGNKMQFAYSHRKSASRQRLRIKRISIPYQATIGDQKMSFDISAIMEKLKEIEDFAENVAETKKLADTLAENFAKMKMNINQTINDSFTEIANQIEALRQNMEKMESVKTEAPKVDTPVPAPKSEPTPEVKPAPAPAPAPAPTPTPQPAPAPKTEVKPEPVAAPEPEPVVEESIPEDSDQLDFLLQQKDRLKAQLTDLRFDYMRGYIPEDEYKTKETDLDTQLEDLDKQIAALK
jgi:cell division septation protein DedD